VANYIILDLIKRQALFLSSFLPTITMKFNCTTQLINLVQARYLVHNCANPCVGQIMHTENLLKNIDEIGLTQNNPVTTNSGYSGQKWLVSTYSL
jgi:hypothetical protein